MLLQLRLHAEGLQVRPVLPNDLLDFRQEFSNIMTCKLQVLIKLKLADLTDKPQCYSHLTCIELSNSIFLLQEKDSLQSQLNVAYKINADLSKQSKVEQEQLKEAANKAALAEQQRLQLHDKFEAMQRSLKQAKADRETADQVCLLLSHHSSDCNFWA